ncbi:hypothetical protein C8039_14500 [Halogeometricum sp. wsp3]|nr:hypothetical protein C8039_14500 [Halogeometricum sp. wsp3]
MLDTAAFSGDAVRYEGTVDSGKNEKTSVASFGEIQAELASSTSPSYDLICCIGFAQKSALKQTSKNSRPEVHAGRPDRPRQRRLVHVQEHEGSFLAGNLAGLLTTQSSSSGQARRTRTRRPSDSSAASTTAHPQFEAALQSRRRVR